jgi:hypothetical protein
LVGQFKKAKVGFIHIFIAVDKFTKWIEVKPTASITVTKTMEFIKEIMYKIGVPNNIITNNETQFTVKEFKDICANSGIKINYTQCHTCRAVECSNGMVLLGLKPKIFDRLKPYTGEWVKELPSVLWALRTTLSHDIDHTPFSLVYGSEAMLPTKVEHKSFCVQHFNAEQSNDS